MSSVTLRSEQSVVRGQASGAAMLFERHSDRVFGYCLRCLGSRADAEDAVQTTFLYAHRALERGIVPESEYAWLHAIAKNVCRWQQRTIARRGPLSSDVDLDTLPGRGGDEGDARELLMGLDEALASIPESQRRAILLREWQGLSCQEVASRLGTSPAATYALLTRARRSLAKALTALPQRPALGLDVGSLLLKLKALVAGGTANVAATTAVVAGVVLGGGVVVEKAIHADSPRPPAPAAERFLALDASERQAIAPRSSGQSGVAPVATTPTRSPRDEMGAGSSPHGGSTLPGAGVGGLPGVPSPLDGPMPGPPPPAAAPVPELPEAPSLPTNPLEPLPLPELPGDLPVDPDGIVPPLGGDGGDRLGDLVPDPPVPPPLPEVGLPGLP